VDDLTDSMHTSLGTKIDPKMGIKGLNKLLEEYFNWALEIDFDDRENQRRFWYYSEEKLEPRFGDRYSDLGADQEMPLAVAREVYMLHKQLINFPTDISVGKFLLIHPEFRQIVRRIQTVVRYPYAEIRDNIIQAKIMASLVNNNNETTNTDNLSFPNRLSSQPHFSFNI